MIGRTLSHYTIEAFLGRGGMGEVYQARDTRLDRAVAIKVLPDELAQEGDSLKRFVREAKAASALNHPNIVTVHDIDQHESVHYIVMEKIDGEPLSAQAGKPMPLDRFFEIALQVTSALGAAHEAGIVHRDIKPANVMITRSGPAKVVDFGLARLVEPEQSGSSDDPTVEWTRFRTKPGTILGTAGYMSPEQVQGERATARSDVFSLGVLFHEILSGTAVFRTSSPISTFAAILRDTPPALDTVRDDIPAALSAVVQKCLSKEPAGRYADAAELHEALVAVRKQLFHTGSRVRANLNRWLVAAVLAVALTAGVLAAIWWRHESQIRWARNVAVPEIDRLLDSDDPVQAYVLAKRAREIAPHDSQVQQAWANLIFPMTIKSEPPGAEVAIRSYRNNGGGEWVPLGRTPFTADLPYPLHRYRVSHPGFVTTETAPEFTDTTAVFELHKQEETPEGMVAVPGGGATMAGTTRTVADFWIDRYEVTNAEFKKFVDGGGYRRKELWKHPFERDGKPLTWEAAMRELVDQTGRPGPTSWELGTYPEGKERHPVEGISWYEAAAYAEFVGKSLPTVFHWKRAAANDGVFSDVLAMSNFSGKGTLPVGSLDGLGQWGTYDMGGNVKEWCLNAVDEKRYTLGGSWLDASYFYVEPDAQPPISRTPGFGFRLIFQKEPIASDLTAGVRSTPFEIPPPVDDATFAIFARLFDYDRGPLNARLEGKDESYDLWRRETVSFDAAYAGERVTANLFIPKGVRPPYQAIVYFPGSDAVFMKSSRHLWLRMVEFYIRSGRVVVFPIYKGTYERQVPPSRGPNDILNLRIQGVKDIRRTVDYLQSRSDIDPARIGYYGLSLGATYAAFMLPFEPRFRTAVLFGTGFYRVQMTRPPEHQPQNYLPRIKTPTLLICGRHDFTLPVDVAQRPYFELIGTPPDQKRHVVFDGGHVPTQFNEAVKEILAWTDQWMGAVEAR